MRALPQGCEGGANGTWLRLESAPQPDADLRILPEYGGQSRTDGSYTAGGPELVAAVFGSSAESDLNAKLALYQRAGVLEYLTLVLRPAELVWRRLYNRGMNFWMVVLLAAPAFGQSGWVSLFDGKSLAGWEARATSDAKTNGDWRVEAGAIRCPGSSPGWLSSSRTFSDFELQLEFRGTGKVNSGVFLRSEKEGQPHVTGYELQIWDYQPAGFLTGSLVGTAKTSSGKVLGDQWNRYAITAQGDHMVVLLNGKTVLDVHDSKHLSGVVGFQCQKDNPIEFRNIRIRPLP